MKAMKFQYLFLTTQPDNLACDGDELQDHEPSTCTSISDCVDIDRASIIHDHCYVYGWYEINENLKFA